MDDFVGRIASQLTDRIARHNESREAVRKELEDTVEMLKGQLDQLKARLNAALEDAFAAEDERLGRYSREIAAGLAAPGCDRAALAGLAEDAQAELLVQQTYMLESQASASNLAELYRLRIVKSFCGLEERRPADLSITFDPASCLDVVRLRFFTPREKQVIKENGLDTEPDSIIYKAIITEKDSNNNNENSITKVLMQMDDEDNDNNNNNNESLILVAFLDAKKTYSVRVRAECYGHFTEWSDAVDFAPGFTECCVWKRCPGEVERDRRYAVLPENPRIAVKTTEGGYCWGTIVGNTALPRGSVLFWSVRVLKSRGGDGNGILVGVAPAAIDQNVGNNSEVSGWYYDCYTSGLCSESSPGARRRGYGPCLGDGKHVGNEGTVGVVADTVQGALSFTVNGVDYGTAFVGVPLDRPLVPCVLVKCKDDAVLLDFAMQSTPPSPAVHTPPGIAQTGRSWDSVTLFWGVVAGATFYQINAGSADAWEATTTNTFTKRGLLPGTAHTFRIRAVRGREVSEWSAPVEARTAEQPPFAEASWRRPADTLDRWTPHAVAGKTATKLSEDGLKCLVAGSSSFPLGEATSWGVRVVRSRAGDANGIYVGVAPSDAGWDEDVNPLECGWFLNCYYSTLRSGPPQMLKWKDYGPRKEKGRYVRTGDVVGAVMDMRARTLSFVVGGVCLGVAFESVPIDKPLVPAVVLENKDDSVELITSYNYQNVPNGNFFFSTLFSKKSKTLTK